MNATKEADIRLNQKEMFDRLMAFDITEVKRLLIERDEIPADEVAEMERQYKLYLSFVATNPNGNYPISTKVDRMWHAHLLTTLSYHRMCHEVIGRFLHHVPALDNDHFDRLEADYDANTLTALATSDSFRPEFWPKGKSICQGPYVCQAPVLGSLDRVGALVAA